jgi:hypothetical protein
VAGVQAEPERITVSEVYYVLWTDQGGLKVWSGPYDTFEDARESTPMRDRNTRAFVTLSSAMVRG